MKKMKLTRTAGIALLGTTLLAGCNDANDKPMENTEEHHSTATHKKAPGEVFDLSSWNILLPLDSDGDGQADRVSNKDLQTFQVADFFYLDDDNNMVFAAANKAFTSPTSTNTRSELRQVFVDDQGNVADMDSPKNYFALTSNPRAEEFAALGGRMEATLKVNHVSVNAKYKEKEPAYSVVVGQIHAGKLDELRTNDSGFGWGNEPLKIYYKKFPHHKTGSVFWNYERNLVKEDPNRIDIDYPVWGVGWDDPSDPGDEGIALGESFSYTVNVYGDIMYLTFTADNHPTVKHQINLANNVDGNGDVDKFDDPNGYKNDWLFFKVGAYNQCSTKDAPTFRYPACPGTGDWETDRRDGNYTSVSFSYLNVAEAVPVQ